MITSRNALLHRRRLACRPYPVRDALRIGGAVWMMDEVSTGAAPVARASVFPTGASAINLTDTNLTESELISAWGRHVALFDRTSSQYLSYADDPALRLGAYERVTIVHIFRVSTLPSTGGDFYTLSSKLAAGAANREFSFQVDDSDRLYFRHFSDSGSTITDQTTTPTISVDTWQVGAARLDHKLQKLSLSLDTTHQLFSDAEYAETNVAAVDFGIGEHNLNNHFDGNIAFTMICGDWLPDSVLNAIYAPLAAGLPPLTLPQLLNLRG